MKWRGKSGWLMISALIILNLQLQAGVTGKLKGRITDQATGKPLIGANVVVEGESIGTAADVNGDYYIIAIPPGNYTIRIMMIGYRDMSVSDVEITSDHTTVIHAELLVQVLEADGEVIVVAQRPLVDENVTSSTQFISIEKLNQLPVSDTKEALMMQSGVFFDQIPVAGGLSSAGRGEKRYSIRGGSQDEVMWLINGVRTSTLTLGRADQGGSFTSVNMNAVQEVQVITGGFNAEYGNAQSGIVNVVTKEGGSQLEGSLEYIYGFPGQRHFGDYLYDLNDTSDYEIGIHWVDSTNSLDTAWLTDYRLNQIYDYRQIPDKTVYFTLGGPMFSMGDRKATFFLSTQYKREAYTYPMPRDTRDLENVQLNLSLPVNPKMKLRIEGMYNHEGHATLQEGGDYVWNAKYYRGFGSLLDTYTSLLSASFSHAPSTALFYDIKLSYYRSEFLETPGQYTETGQSSFVDIWGYQYYTGFEGYEEEGFVNYSFIYDKHTIQSDLSAVGSLNWQLTNYHFIKTGFEYHYNMLAELKNYRYTSYTQDPRYWFNRGLHETYYPIQGALYFQDKMEFKSMIMNIGLRYDYFNANRDWFVNEGLYNLAIDPEYDASKDEDGDQVDSDGHVKYSFENVLDKPRAAVEPYHMLSPRFSASFPVIEKSILNFSYGHFYQIPQLDKMFAFSYLRPETVIKGMMAADEAAETSGEDPDHIASSDGDPERVVSLTNDPLPPEKTVSFEVGLQHNISDIARLTLTAYYKNVFNQTEELIGIFDRRFYGWDPFKNQTTNTMFYTGFLSGDYGDSRGIEVNLRTYLKRNFTIDLNYSFAKATQGRASPVKVEYDEEGNATYAWDDETISAEKSYSRPHIFRANLFYSFKKNHISRYLSWITDGTSMSILYSYTSGQGYTYLEEDDNPMWIYNNHRYPPIINTDLRIEKKIEIGDIHALTAHLKVTNLFNRKNLRHMGEYFYGSQAYANYIETGEPYTEWIGYDISQITYFENRQFYFGLSYNF